MEMKRFIYHQEEEMFIGWLEEYPDYRTQGESMEELEENLKDIHESLNQELIPGHEPWERGNLRKSKDR